jgi:hypothetical protein
MFRYASFNGYLSTKTLTLTSRQNVTRDDFIDMVWIEACGSSNMFLTTCAANSEGDVLDSDPKKVPIAVLLAATIYTFDMI